MLLRYLLFIVLLFSFSYSNNILVGIVKITKVNIQKVPMSGQKFKLNSINKGTLLEIESCDKFDWCKLKNEGKYIPKYALGLMLLKASPFVYDDEEKINLSEVQPLIIKKSIASKCIKLETINIDENKIFTTSKQNQVLKKYKNNKCLNIQTIRTIIKDIVGYYTKNGYTTTRPFLIPQNLNDGILDINISIGKIDKIISKESNKSTSNIIFAFIGQVDNPLNLRDIETSLESMNRVPSSKSTFKIKPSQKRGNSIVEVETKKTQLPFDLTFGLSGMKTLKHKNPSVVSTVSFYNPLSINDILRFSLNGSYIQKNYQSSKGHEVNYSFPLGSYIFELIKSYSTYRQGVDGINNVYLSNGNTHGYKMKVSKVLFRNQKNKFKTSVGIYHKNTKNYFEGNEIETSSYKTTYIQLDLIHTLLQNWGQIGTTFSMHQGKDWLGARGDDYRYGESDYITDSTLEFTKYTLGINTSYNFANNYTLTSNFHYQYSKDNLYSSDKFTLGSDSSIRGYSGNYYGNIGWYLHNTFTKDIEMDINDLLLKNIAVFMGTDIGQAPCKSDNKNSCGRLYGGGIGLKSDGKHFSSNFSLNRPFKKIDEDFKLENQFKWTLTMKF